MEGLQMMTYKKANKILTSFLTPDNRCITRGVGEASLADEASIISWIESQGYQSSDFPSNRLMPTAATKNKDITTFCYIPIDDLVMHLGSYQYREEVPAEIDGKPNPEYKYGGTDIVKYNWPVHTDDSAMDGYDYEIDKDQDGNPMIIYEDPANAGWLTVTPIKYDPSSSKGVIDGHPTYNAICYAAKNQPSGADTRRAKVVFKAKKNDRYDSLTNPATDVCTKFIVTVQQDPAADGPDHTGATIATLNNTGTVTIKNTQSSTTNNVNVDFVVMFRSLSGYSGYWTKAGYIGSDSSIKDCVSIVENDGVEIINVNMGSIISPDEDTRSKTTYRFFVFGNWSGAKDPGNGNPPVAYNGGNVSTSISDGTNTTTISRKIRSTGNLNVPTEQPYAESGDIITRCSCLMEVRYDNDTNKIIVKEPDSDDTWNLSGIIPTFYPAGFTWQSEGGLTTRVYDAKQGARGTTTIGVVSKDNTDDCAYRIYVNDPSDTNTYKITANGGDVYLNYQNPQVIDATSFLIDFSGVESGSITKRFKLEQYIPAERPRIHNGNASPEYAEIAFTFQ